MLANAKIGDLVPYHAYIPRGLWRIHMISYGMKKHMRGSGTPPPPPRGAPVAQFQLLGPNSLNFIESTLSPITSRACIGRLRH
eukprot:jgi/Botrbrau1/13341/Bobra.0334s0017.1